MKHTAHSNPKQPQFKDVSRFTRWIANMDRQDESLSPMKRKTKWLLLLVTLALCFVLSFILFPSTRLNHETVGEPLLMHEPTATGQKTTHPFEMPVDSFENFIKNKINENEHDIHKEK